ncbi:MAG: acyl-CoA dehydrogenase family protein [Myxococcota bacterium]
MDFELTETQTLVQKAARDFAAATIAPQAKAIEDGEHIPDALLAQLGELGLMGVNLPENYGGSAAGVVAYSLAMSEISRACASTSVTMAVVNMVGEVIEEFGNDAQREMYIPMTCSGKRLGAFALSEVGAGSDPGALRTTATQDGDHWIIRGDKQWISHADRSGVMVVWARTSGEGTRGLSCFLVPGDAEGVRIGKKEDKMGLRGSATCALVFEDVRVPASALLGEEGQGFKIAMMALDGGRIGIASQAIGIGEAALAAALSYAKERKTFGKAIADYQAIQWMIADSRTELDAARLLTLRAALRKEQGAPFTREASMAKVYASEAAWRVCDRALQIHGGYGYTREFPVERYLRDVRVTRIYEGTSEVQRIVISRQVLKG